MRQTSPGIVANYMKKLKIFSILLSLLVFGCEQRSNRHRDHGNDENKNVTMTKEDLLNHVKLAINPKYQDWVLFENGTYIIFDNADTIADLELESIRQMKEYGPVFAGGPAGDFSVTHLNQTEGWIVSGHGYGMYTYVNPNELTLDSPSDLDIGIYGRSKRDKDGKTFKIVHLNRK